MNFFLWLRIVRRSSVLFPLFILFPFHWHAIVAIPALVLAYVDVTNTHAHQDRRNIGQTIAKKRIPFWVFLVIAFTWYHVTLTRDDEVNPTLVATEQGWSLNCASRELLSQPVTTVVMVVIILAPLIFFLFLPGKISFGFIDADLIGFYLIGRYTWRYLLEPLNTRAYTNIQPSVRTYLSFVPQTRGPAFSYETLTGPHICLDARGFYRSPPNIHTALLAHEYGHIRLGHLALLSTLRSISMAMIGAWLGYLLFFSTRYSHGGLIAAIVIFLSLLILALPYWVRPLLESKHETQADRWATQYMDSSTLQHAKTWIRQLNLYH